MSTHEIPPLSGQFEALVFQVFKTYPSGLRGSRQDLLDSLVYHGLNQEDAELALRSLEEARQAHNLGGHWVFTHHPIDLPQLLRLLEGEYPEFVGHDPTHLRTEACEYIAQKWGIDLDVATEVLQDLEAAGYASLGPDPAYQRDRLLFGQP